MLRAGTWMPRRCALRVTVGKPITPGGPGWSNALALRDAARAAMTASLAEHAFDE
jgi:hypothetical protein